VGCVQGLVYADSEGEEVVRYRVIEHCLPLLCLAALLVFAIMIWMMHRSDAGPGADYYGTQV
jgi:hypothetical protein